MASVDQRGKRFSVRYRNQGDASPKRHSLPRGATRREAERLAREIQTTIDKRGWWEAPREQAAAALADGAPTNLEELVEAHINHAAELGRAENTLRVKRSALRPLWKFIRGDDKRRAPPAIGALTLRNVERYLADVRKRRTESTANGYGRQVAAFWKWAHERWPDLVPVVHMPRLEAPPPALVLAPTFDEVDRMVAQLSSRAEGVRRMMLIQRWQGVRVSQAGALEVGDFVEDWHGLGPALQIRKGKSRREKAQARWVPVAPDLAKRLRSWCAGRPADEVLVGRVPRDPADTVGKAWERAGLQVPSQPTHAIRKRFISHLVEQGASDAAIDYLVGHAPKGVRSRHYVDPRAFWPQLLKAIKTIPPLTKHERISTRRGR